MCVAAAESSRPPYREIVIGSEERTDALHSTVLLVPSLLTTTECEMLTAAADVRVAELVERHLQRHGAEDPAEVPLPTWHRFEVATLACEPSRRVVEDLMLNRVPALLEAHAPAIA